ncbi:hypothetical protein [Streptomyces sp. CBMA29]|uniref:hypothetical protein n=1 Tax=Streptomyces sp. CBMA29 TaxID=1896314 RepID=UPI001CB70625|nr:hypothetical protein [Streptomyces sp. CBMA29]
MRYGRRATIAVAFAAGAAITLAGCGGGGGGGDKADNKPSTSASASKNPGSSGGDSAAPSATPTQVLAQVKGDKNMEITINSAVRDSGGFVTVEGVATNNGTELFTANDWAGNETALSASGASVAGAILVDEAGKKRYYILRDTDGRCLCTMGLVGIQPKESRPFFAQFPAPPEATTQVSFELPTMPPAKITISEG